MSTQASFTLRGRNPDVLTTAQKLGEEIRGSAQTKRPPPSAMVIVSERERKEREGIAADVAFAAGLSDADRIRTLPFTTRNPPKN